MFKLKSIILIFFLVLVSIQSYAQKDSTRKYSHCMGGGMQWLTAISYGKGHDITNIHYASPSPFGFYRFIISRSNNNKLYFSLSGFQRKGFGNHSGGGLGGGGNTAGTFNFVRVDLGINYSFALDFSKKTSIGFGTSLGFIPYIESNMEKYEWSLTKGSSVTQVSAFDGISKINFTISIDLNHEFKITSASSLIIGIKGMLETPDGFNGVKDSPFWYPSRAGKVVTPYQAYRLGKL